MDAEANLAIRDLKNRYCHRIDAGDYEEWVSLFADGGVFARAGVDEYDGRDELTEFATEVFDPAYEFSAHTVSNPVIEVDGDTATGEWYVTLRFRTPDGEAGWKQAVYRDEFVKEGGEWRFDSVTIEGRASETHARS